MVPACASCNQCLENIVIFFMHKENSTALFSEETLNIRNDSYMRILTVIPKKTWVQ
ncbi:uncharacterized protein LOC117174498 isoform X2 [Belonocnema kinseyi]|uniref:uncharacterized protein LOC117174498 isoform X2 n=1 Tax=Belonocnema kinseyi TaxID=2817044 RepID=UPI00143D1B39|nr:uncharacterized protein LOC117174498 isoform X2 [Belonocnema kinseyi]